MAFSHQLTGSSCELLLVPCMVTLFYIVKAWFFFVLGVVQCKNTFCNLSSCRLGHCMHCESIGILPLQSAHCYCVLPLYFCNCDEKLLMQRILDRTPPSPFGNCSAFGHSNVCTAPVQEGHLLCVQNDSLGTST